MTAYAELQVTSNFSFLRGASHPEELVATAAALGQRAVAITDRNTLAGVVRAHAVAKLAEIPFIVGARLDLDDAPSLLCFPTDRAAYGRLSRLLTLGRRRAPKGECRLGLADVLESTGRAVAVLGESVDDVERVPVARDALSAVAARLDPAVVAPGSPVTESMVVLMMRPLVIDLLMATGLDHAEARRRLAAV